MAKTLSQLAATSIRSQIDTVTSDPKGIPGAVFCVVGKDGNLIFSHASGTLGSETKAPMDLDTVFSIASCTKMITGIAAMQLVEKGQLHLDDADEVERLCPELKTKQILKGIDDNGKPILVDKKNRITLRMLLSHTAGFGYSFFNHNLRRFKYPAGLDELSLDPKDIYDAPLLFEPGTQWEYGINIDWAGELIMRQTKMTLEEYFQQNIFQPLGLKNMSLLPNEGMKAKMAHLNQRDLNGNLQERDHIFRIGLKAEGEELKRVFQSGGAGCFAKPTEYCQIIATLLNNGTSPTTGAKLLNPETVDEMFRNQIPEFPNFGRQGIPASKPDQTNAIPDLYPQPPEQPQGWGLTFMVTMHPGATGRGGNTGFWAGLPNLFWWADREKGVGGMIASQILPFADPTLLGLWVGCESKVYQGLQ